MNETFLIAAVLATLVVVALLLWRLLASSRTQDQAQTLDQGERLRSEIVALKIAQIEGLASHREGSQQKLAELGAALQKLLAEQARADQELLANTLRGNSQQLSLNIEAMTRTMDERLEKISGKVAERLDEGFKKTNETFVNVMTRLATIDERRVRRSAARSPGPQRAAGQRLSIPVHPVEWESC
jgi:hypothetical protein